MTEYVPASGKHRVDHGGSRGGNGGSLSLLEGEQQGKQPPSSEDGDTEVVDRPSTEKQQAGFPSTLTPLSASDGPPSLLLVGHLPYDTPKGRETALLALLTQAEFQLQATKAEFHQEIEALSEQISLLESECCFKSKEIEALTEKLTSAYEAKEELICELQSMEEQTKELECELHSLRKDAHRKERQLSELQSEVFQSESMVSAQELTDMKRRLSEVVGKHSESERKQTLERTMLEAELTRLQTNNAKLKLACSQADTELKAAKDQTMALTAAVDEWKTKADTLAEQARTNCEQANREMTVRLVQLTWEKTELQRKVDELTFELEQAEASEGEFSLMDELKQVEEDQGNDRMSGPGVQVSDFSAQTDTGALTQLRSELAQLQASFHTETDALMRDLAFAQSQAIAAKVDFAEAMTQHEQFLQCFKTALKLLPSKYQRMVSAQLAW